MAAHDSHHVIEHTGCLRPGVARALAAAVAAVHVFLIAVVLRGDVRVVASEMAGRAGTGTVFASLVPNAPAATAAAGAPISASDAGKPRACGAPRPLAMGWVGDDGNRARVWGAV